MFHGQAPRKADRPRFPSPGMQVKGSLSSSKLSSARHPWGCRSLKTIKQAGRLALPLQWSRHGLEYEPRSQVQGEGPRQGKDPAQVRAWRRLTTEPLEGFLPHDCLCCGLWQATWPCLGHRDLKKRRGAFAQHPRDTHSGPASQRGSRCACSSQHPGSQAWAALRTWAAGAA